MNAPSMTVATWGAHPGGWDRFAETLGLTEDLLPVVSNPSAEISPDSKMQEIGKTPSRYNGQRKVAGIKEWTKYRASESDIKRWRGEPDYGICIQTRRVRAIDVDIPDAALAGEVEEFIAAHLGRRLPKRHRANSAKFLLAFELEGDYGKRKITVAEGKIIELLMTGQQFIACGTHPSGARYEWEGGLPRSLPVLAADEFEILFGAIQARFGVSPATTSQVSERTKGAHLDIDDPVVSLIEERGMVHGEHDGGFVITCPWEHEHTMGDPGDGRTLYYPAGANGRSERGFKCLHGHCEQRKLPDFLGEIGYVENGADDFDPLDEQDMVEARRAIADIMASVDLFGADVAVAGIKEHLPVALLSAQEHAALQDQVAEAVGVGLGRARTLLPLPPRSRFASTPFGDILDPKPVAWFIKGVLPQLDIGMLFGASGSGKSFLILDMAAAIVRGVPWRGRKVKQGEVAYIAAEGARGFRQRVQAYIRHFGPEAGAALRAGFRIHEIAPNLMAENDAKELAKTLRAEGSPKLVIIDTLAQVTPGGDENNSKDMKTAMNHARAIGRATGAMVVVVHHSGKDASKGARGWSGLKGDVDVELEVSRAGDDRTLTVSKLKEGREGDKYGFKLLDIPLGMDDDGEVYGSCVVEHGPVAAKAPARGKGKWQKRVDAALDDLAGLDDRLVPRAQVEDRVLEIALENDGPPSDGQAPKSRTRSIRDAIDGMVEDETLVQKGTFIGRGRGES